MDKTAIRNFAVKARRKLIEDITHKAYEIGITKDKILDIETFEGGFRVKGRENGKTFKKYELKQRDKLIHNIKHKGFEQVIEEVAYTWFNRFIALRFMEVNNYLPTGVRVLSSIEEGKTEPDIIQEALNIDLDLDPEIVYRLQDSNDTEDLYRYLLVKQCNQLGKIMPNVFEEIADYTELLLPDKLLAEGSVIRDLVEEIEEYDWKIELNEEEQKREAEKGEHGIEIIGWLYQYYISEKKDEVFAGLKKNKKITKENIPAATQLFTPKWIVKYMVENSLGRLWLESHPNEELKAQWKYYLEEAEQEPEVQKQLDELKDPNLDPEDIKVLDPAMGSGHILVYAFDVLYEIYLSAGYSEREIPTLILEKNLYGLDIDDRAGQLATFALLMKARSKNRRIFRHKPKMNLCSIQESNDIPREAIEYLVSPKETKLEKHFHREDVEYLIEVFHDAKEYGSILEVKKIDFDALEKRIEEIRNNVPEDLFELQYREIILEKIPPLIQQAKIMSQKYDVVCTNPPYMGRKGMNTKVLKYINKHYSECKSDLYAVFIIKCNQITKLNSYQSMITQQSWMYLTSFKELRKKLLMKTKINEILHLGANAFEEISGEVVQSCAFTIKNIRVIDNRIQVFDLYNYKDAKLIQQAFEEKWCKTYQTLSQKDYLSMPSKIIGYRLNKDTIQLYKKNEVLDRYYEIKRGPSLPNNDKYIRRWFEVSFQKIQMTSTKSKWRLCTRSGSKNKWYDIILDVIDERILHQISNYSYQNKRCIVWPDARYGSTSISAIIKEEYVAVESGMNLIYKNEKNDYNVLLALFNTYLYEELLSNMVNGQHFSPIYIKKLPFFKLDKDFINYRIDSIIDNLKKLEKHHENSINFKGIKVSGNLKQSSTNFIEWNNELISDIISTEKQIEDYLIKSTGIPKNEYHNYNNKYFIEINSEQDYVKSFISYAVGCMFGRYSLDEEGLIYAGGDFDDKFRIRNGQWEIKTKEGWKKSRVNIVEHNVIPIVDGDYFEDGILERFVEFVKVSFGEETLEENLDYIAETLGRKANETSRQAIRRYFLKDFYKDHVRTYKNRPIYWLFDSGRQDGFKALIYMHRYDSSTVARVRTDYLHSLQKKYEAEINHLDILIDSDISQREKAAARKKKEKILKQIEECRLYDEAIAHVANQRIEIDLDDGVKVNYAKFQGVEIPQGKGRKPLKADLLAKI
ncbi:Eco57I restriction-modification methylase [Clostridium cochlearium]|uniref:site-specific DNA-methyltransferase (adenine-specific) n=1 Tax=Clostridium cochlearium TaxID=1494 RepID=A0ABY0QN97_CLOCO|nr:BREX-1 system adenine-specific DNA-methyltransferase PglX [Clostridium cochlearium]SDL35359.1 Eco57I restriction-modification methylase [Clostridium cochlearium]